MSSFSRGKGSYVFIYSVKTTIHFRDVLLYVARDLLKYLEVIAYLVSAACCGSAYGAFDSLFVIVYYACIQMYTVLALAI